MRFTKVALATALTVAGLVATPAQATSTAYCNPTTPPGSTSVPGVTGSVTYAPPVVSPTVPVLSHWRFDLTLFCNSGLPKAQGTYHLVINGTSSEICATGGGGGTVDSTLSAKTAGVGSGSVANGVWQYSRYGLRYYGYPAPVTVTSTCRRRRPPRCSTTRSTCGWTCCPTSPMAAAPAPAAPSPGTP
jgi:hypothetical protein